MMAFSKFIERHANAKPRRYFVRTGAHTCFENGFSNKDQAAQFIKEAQAEYGLDWRVGWLFRLRGIVYDLEIVDRAGNAPKVG
jgi:hypothetical protein